MPRKTTTSMKEKVQKEVMYNIEHGRQRVIDDCKADDYGIMIEADDGSKYRLTLTEVKSAA